MIVVSGGKGFIGTRLVQAFMRTNTVVSIHSGEELSERTGLIEIGFHHPDLPVLLRETKVFIHAAGRIKGSESQFQQANIDTTGYFAQLLPDTVESIVHLSSVNVYISNLDPYGRTKQRSEQIWQESRHAQKTIILRCSLVYGPGDQNNLYRLIALIRRWPILVLPKAGTFRPVYIQDLVRLIVKLAASETSNMGIWDVSGDDIVTLYGLSRLIAAYLPNKKIIIPVSGGLLSAGQAVTQLVKLNRVSNRLARVNVSKDYFNPDIWNDIQNQRTPLPEGVRTTVEAYLRDITF